MVPHYDEEKGNKAYMLLWCKLGIIINVNESFFRKYCQWRDSPENMTGKTADIPEYVDFFNDKVSFKDNDDIYILVNMGDG